jgi:hypothetical protein
MRVKPAAPARVATDKKIAATGPRCDQIRHARSLFPDLANAVAGAFDVIAARPKLYLHLGSWGGHVRQVGGEDEAIDAAEWAAAARNVELGSSPSSIAKGSDIPNDFVLRRMGLAP